jgi:hypothetical protein
LKRIVTWGLLGAALVFGRGGTIAAEVPAPLYRDITAESGIDFRQSNGATGTKQYIELMGSGGCLLDYDADGRFDLYLVNSVGANQLYRNLGGLRFENVTARAGLGHEGYGMGAFAADVDNDGDTDIFVTNFGPNALYLNEGDGTFREIAARAGIDDARWGTGAAFFDADSDGWLDLYLVNYVQMAVPDTNECYAEQGAIRLYCPPRRYPRAKDVFYRNRGDGTFVDATEVFGGRGLEGRGLGVIAGDFDRDGRPDVYVANDLDPNFLFHNQGGGTFEEIGMLAGASHSEDGREESGMGLAAGDYDNDGWIDLFVSNFVNETNTLYRNEGGLFLDASATSRVGPQSLPFVSWGTEFFDFDLDGWKDLFVANGHTESDVERIDPTSTWKQPDFLYHNRGDGTFAQITATVAPSLVEHRAGRGAVFGDLDDDGDIDFVVVNQNDPLLFLENAGVPGHHWIGFHLEGTESNRDAVGARVEIHAGDLVTVREVRAGSSYLSSNDPRVHFGLGERDTVDSVDIRWPSGREQTIHGLAVDRYHRIIEGK